MPDKKTLERARADKRAGKSPSTQAGEFVREEMHHIREGKHGAESTKQVIAIGLSKARRAGVDLPPSPKGGTSRQAKSVAKRRSAADRSRTAKKAARTKGAAGRKAAARKAARTRARRASR